MQIVSLLLLLSVFLVSPARAADLVVFDADRTAGATQAEHAARAALPHGEIGETMELGAFLAGDNGVAHLHGQVEQLACQGEPISAAAMARLLGECEQALQDLSLDGVGEIFERSLAALPCADEVIPPETLTDLYFQRGLLAVYSGERTVAVEYFREALAVAPDRAWDPTYPPEAFQIYLEAMERHYHADPLTLPLLLDASAGVYIDGASRAGEQTVELAPGSHFLQLEVGDHVSTFQIRVGGAEQLLLASDASLARVVLDGPRVPHHAWAARERLGAGARAHGADAVVVVAGPSVYRYDIATDSYDVLKEPLDRHGKALRAGATMTIAGLGTAVAGVLIAVSAVTQSPEHPAEPTYPTFYKRNQFGWGLAIGGGVVAAIGIPLALSNRPARITASWDGTTERFAVGLEASW